MFRLGASIHKKYRLATTAIWLLGGKPSAGAFSQAPQPVSTSCRALDSTRSALPRISISDAYDGGNIEWGGDREQATNSAGHTLVSLKIKPDPYTELEQKSHFQYFSFRSTITHNDDLPHTVEYSIENAANASYAVAWDESTVFYSHSLSDPDSWRRKVDTTFADGKLRWKHDHDGTGSVYFSYFPPYSYSRHLDLVKNCSKYAKVVSLGQTLDGRELDCIQVGTGDRIGWFIHQQHPGEDMAEFYAEGLLTRLLGLDTQGDVDGLVRQLLKRYTFYIVPSMNPDGAVRGHLRTNAVGANLNREWASSEGYEAPTLERSPEVFFMLRKMDETGCDVFLDIHGDEGLPFNFLAQACVPNWGPRLQALHGAFLAAYSRTNPDMQQKFAYETSDYQEGDSLNIASDQIAHRFGCLSATLEMPFKDCWSNPDPERGWSPARARKLGASVVEPLMHIHRFLREKGEFWESLAPEDAYCTPTSKYK